jgi:hypothetical protein
MKIKILFSALLLGVSLLFSTVHVNAQCAMCKRAAESNMNDNQSSVGKGLNKGILYLLSIPYILGGIGLVAWYSEKRKKRRAQELSNEISQIS